MIYIVRRYEYDAAKGKGYSIDIETYSRRRDAENLRDKLKKETNYSDYYVWPCFRNLPNPNEV